MNRAPKASRRVVFLDTVSAVVLLLCASWAMGQDAPNERTFRQSKAVVEKVLRGLQASTSGRLPTLDGFALAGEHPLDRYQRAYYQSIVQVSATASGGSVVRVNTKVTAWYADAVPGRSGYKLLPSNGRLETDLLDQLAEQLISMPGNVEARAPKSATLPREEGPGTAEPIISAPVPNQQRSAATFSSTTSRGLSAQELIRAYAGRCRAPSRARFADSGSRRAW